MKGLILVFVILSSFVSVAGAEEPKSPVHYAGWVELAGYEQYILVEGFKAGYETALMTFAVNGQQSSDRAKKCFSKISAEDIISFINFQFTNRQNRTDFNVYSLTSIYIYEQLKKEAQ